VSAVVSRSFQTDLTIDQILAALRSGAPAVQWQIRDSEYDGRYINGRWGATRLRIVDYGEYWSCEIYFSGESSPAEQDVTSYVDQTVLPIAAGSS
jgi:hypothetical protein